MNFPKIRKYSYTLLKFLKFKVRPNNVGVHFSLSLKPIHIVACDFFIFRLNIYWPLFISISGGLKGKRGLQLYGGLKYDATSEDYLFSCALRFHLLGTNVGIGSQGSL